MKHYMYLSNISIGFRAPYIIEMFEKNKRSGLGCVTEMDSIFMYANDSSVLPNGFWWPCPRHSMIGDVALFYYGPNIAHNVEKVLGSSCFTDEEMRNALKRNLDQYKRYLGKIFGYAIITDSVEGKGINYAKLDNFRFFECPFEIHGLKVKFGSTYFITPLFGESAKSTKERILKYNDDRFIKSLDIIPNKLVVKKINWYQVNRECGHQYTSYRNFYSNYAKYLIATLSETTVQLNCKCFKKGVQINNAEYVIKIKGRYVPVAIRYDINEDPDIIKNLQNLLSSDCVLNSGTTVKMNHVIAVALDENDFCIITDRDKDQIKVGRSLSMVQTGVDVQGLKKMMGMFL